MFVYTYLSQSTGVDPEYGMPFWLVAIVVVALVGVIGTLFAWARALINQGRKDLAAEKTEHSSLQKVITKTVERLKDDKLTAVIEVRKELEADISILNNELRELTRELIERIEKSGGDSGKPECVGELLECIRKEIRTGLKKRSCKED